MEPLCALPSSTAMQEEEEEEEEGEEEIKTRRGGGEEGNKGEGGGYLSLTTKNCLWIEGRQTGYSGKWQLIKLQGETVLG